MTRPFDPQVAASDPVRSVFVTANAGSGKTSTLVKRVARLLLRGAAPETILCVTYTKAAAAEMQRRLFDELGGWAVMADAPLAAKLADLDERPDDLSAARALFARALETPGGLKIQTIHAFCEKLLRRFPLEAGVSPGFSVLEDAAAREISARARDDVAHLALMNEAGPIDRAYAHFSVQLDWNSFNAMFATFEARRAGIAAYVAACDGAYAADVWARCGFAAPTPVEAIEAEALAGLDWVGWRAATEALALGSAATDQPLGAAMRALGEDSAFAEVWGLFCTQAGKPRAKMATNAVDAAAKAWLAEQQARLGEAAERIKAARVAQDTVHVLNLALTYAELYEGAKTAGGGLDFGDLIARTHALLTVKADAAWVLYKLDGGIEHVLLDEAQDTAPDQWDILHALTEEFFAGGATRPVDERTVFAVGDEKQSIYSFQGAAPERFVAEAGAFRALIEGVGRPFDAVPLLESWRSTPEVLDFVDAVFADDDARAGLRPAADDTPVVHVARRDAGFGAVDFWPLEEGEPSPEVDPWAPVDLDPPESATKKLARRIARWVRAVVARREAVFDREARAWRPARFGDVLILVRRRNALFHEIIRALKREGVAVGGADRLTLSDHVVFDDLMALGRFARFASDDLTLAGLLRSPFCDIDEEGLFDLAHDRAGALWPTLVRRADERPEWTEARAFLGWAIEAGQGRPPFDFYARVLSRLDGAGRSMRARLLTRLGREAEDALDAFLGEALAAEQRGVRDLERFLAQMAASEIEVKREQEDRPGPAGGEVRVMTAHGAKGLEAPIVILPDTTTRATAQGGPLLSAEGGGFLWAPRKADDCPASGAARARRDLAGAHESLRLLYVALTRARDRLVVCGVRTRDASYAGSWHEVASRALARPEVEAGLRLVAEGDIQFTRFGFDPRVVAAAAPAVVAGAPLPDWARRFAPAEPAALRYASPSTLAESERGPAPSPLAERQGLGRYRRGLIVHRLLQLLPDLAPAARREAAVALLAREPDLTDAQRAEMAAAALAVLEDARFAAVFGPGSRAEAAVAGAASGLPAGLAVSGRVDRLLVRPDRVLVVDFKTNRPAPDRIEDADPAYLTQMAVYAAVLAEVFPGRRIEAALVWTDGPRLMPVPENIVAATLARLRAES
ncbi:MAG: double-strand break repair helicase AddA [Caulobacteraceae bacterium]|nr:double-strand break repair helicase AddA [Caulobacteraceae bacterium]